MKNIVKLNEAQLTKIVAESVKKVLNELALNESFASGKLSQFAQQHQGVKNVVGLNPYQKSNIDISQIPDEQIQNIVPCTQQTLGNVARQIKNGVTIFFNDGTMAAVQISGNNIPSSNRANPYNQGTKYDGQIANPSMGMQQYRNKLAKTNPEARRQMTDVLSKTRGSYNV